MTTSNRRRLTRAAAAITLAAGLAVTAATAPASAAGDGTWWYSYMDVDTAGAAGITGAGVKIAVVDAAINPDAATFDGANLTVSPLTACGHPNTSTDEVAFHATTVTSLINGRSTSAWPVHGIAPDAAVTFYSAGGYDIGCYTRVDVGPTDIRDYTSFDMAYKQAIADGNDIIVAPYGAGGGAYSDEIIAEAIARQVIIVASESNAEKYEGGTDRGNAFPAWANGVLSVAAIDENTMLVKGPDGTEVERPLTAVVAPGDDIAVPASSSPLDFSGSSVGGGTSYSAPLVAGALALAMQRYPEASHNQIVQSLLHTTVASQRGYEPEYDGWGWGVPDVQALLSTDPTQYPDENPLMDFRRVYFDDSPELWKPTKADVAAVADELGLTVPDSWYSDATPSPSATASTPATAPSASSTASSAGESTSLTPLVIGGVGAVVVIATVVIIVVVRQRRRPTSSAPTPHTQGE